MKYDPILKDDLPIDSDRFRFVVEQGKLVTYKPCPDLKGWEEI